VIGTDHARHDFRRGGRRRHAVDRRGRATAGHCLRRAVGATRRAIVRQFLVETTMITVTGGFLGTLVGIVLSQLVAYFAGWSTIVSVASVAIASVVSVSIGIVFGLYPAIRAADLDPVRALHYE
jgi:putative ABC transport system permease protein